MLQLYSEIEINLLYAKIYPLFHFFHCWVTVLAGGLRLLLTESERLHDLPVEIAVVVGAPQVGNPPVVVVTEVCGTAWADGAQVVLPPLSPEISAELSRLQGTGGSLLSLSQSAPAEVEVFPGAHDLPASSVE